MGEWMSGYFTCVNLLKWRGLTSLPSSPVLHKTPA
jgi:hypothetical protein